MDVKPLVYPAKIMLAWGEAISGNTKIRDWLIQNGYQELGIFVYALHLKDDARKWLMENGYPHLMAMINGVERNEKALVWLHKNNFPVLEKMALAADGYEDALNWLLDNGHKEFAMIAKRIEVIKDQIEANNNDPHRISPE